MDKFIVPDIYEHHNSRHRHSSRLDFLRAKLFEVLFSKDEVHSPKLMHFPYKLRLHRRQERDLHNNLRQYTQNHLLISTFRLEQQIELEISPKRVGETMAGTRNLETI